MECEAYSSGVAPVDGTGVANLFSATSAVSVYPVKFFKKNSVAYLTGAVKKLNKYNSALSAYSALARLSLWRGKNTYRQRFYTW